MPKRFITMLIAPLLLIGCSEEPTVERYEVTRPVGFDWPVTERREARYEADSAQWVWDIPAGWVQAPEVPDQLIADYRFKGASESLPGRLTVSKIDGDAGGIEANVMRWLQQLYLTQVRGLGPKDKVLEPIANNLGSLTFVDLHGQYQGEHTPTRMTIAIIQFPQQGGGVYQTWFFKLAGDDATVDANRMGLVQMALTFRPEIVPRPDLPGIDDQLPALDEASEESTEAR